MIKFPGTVLGRSQLDATAHGAWRPATHGRSKKSRGRGLATRPSGENSPCGPWHRACAARSRRGHCAQSARAVARSPTAHRRQGVAGEHRWGPGEASGKKSGDGAHRDGGAAGAVVFNGGGVAPVVVDVRGRVLQHRCGRGKRDLAPIRGMMKLGGRSPERGKTAASLGKL
jgi:hypothetical protein